MDSLTDRQKVIAIHLLVVFPLLILVLLGKDLFSINTETLRKVALGVIAVGVVTHIYFYFNPEIPLLSILPFYSKPVAKATVTA